MPASQCARLAAGLPAAAASGMPIVLVCLFFASVCFKSSAVSVHVWIGDETFVHGRRVHCCAGIDG